MDFKVNPLQYAVNLNAYKSVARPAKPGVAVKQAGDQVDVSGSTALFKSMLQAVSDHPEVRIDKVNAIKAQIESGDYTVDSRAIAEKMLGYVNRL